MVSCGLSLKPIHWVKNGEKKTSASPGIFPAAVNGWSHWGDKPLADLRASAVNFKFWQFSCDRKNGNIIRNRCFFVGFDATISTILVSGFPYCQMFSPGWLFIPIPRCRCGCFQAALGQIQDVLLLIVTDLDQFPVDKNDQLTTLNLHLWGLMKCHATKWHTTSW